MTLNYTLEEKLYFLASVGYEIATETISYWKSYYHGQQEEIILDDARVIYKDGKKLEFHNWDLGDPFEHVNELFEIEFQKRLLEIMIN